MFHRIRKPALASFGQTCISVSKGPVFVCSEFHSFFAISISTSSACPYKYEKVDVIKLRILFMMPHIRTSTRCDTAGEEIH